jgi:hypothetical protein
MSDDPINVFAWQCSVPNAPWCDRGETHWHTVNAPTRGAAKAYYWRHVCDAWPDIAFTEIMCRKKGPPESDAAFLIGVRYRGIPDVRCGDCIGVPGGDAVVVGFGGGGAWLEVVNGNGLRGYVHPAECSFRPRQALGGAKP